MASAARLLTLEFLRWVAAKPRGAAEAREAWRSTCPLTCAWEDALSDGLVGFAADTPRSACLVLTPAGEAALAAAETAHRQGHQEKSSP
jgi:hypothetical protein